MNPHGPHDQRGTAHWGTENAAMDAFTLRLPRWPVLLRLLGRDPLVRTTDRIEALVSGAGCRGVAACHPDRRRRRHRGLRFPPRGLRRADHTRHTRGRDGHRRSCLAEILRTGTATVAARWTAGGAEHTGAVKAQSATKTGDTVAIWVDDNGAQAAAPTPTTRAAVEAATAALVHLDRRGRHARRPYWPSPGQCVTVSAPPDGNTSSTAWSAATGTNPANPKAAANPHVAHSFTSTGEPTHVRTTVVLRHLPSSPMDDHASPIAVEALAPFCRRCAGRLVAANRSAVHRTSVPTVGVVVGSGTIERVIYDENSWALASLRMEFRGHSVIL